MRKSIAAIAVIAALALTLIAASAGTAGANPYGITGKYKSGCKPCHGQTAGLAGQVLIQGPATLKANERATYQVLLLALPPGPIGGLNAAVEDSANIPSGSMFASLNTKNKKNFNTGYSEITHDEGPTGKAVNGRLWSFDWQAPAAPGAYTLMVAANAANGNGTSDFDNLPKGVADGWYLGTQKIDVAP